MQLKLQTPLTDGLILCLVFSRTANRPEIYNKNYSQRHCRFQIWKRFDMPVWICDTFTAEIADTVEIEAERLGFSFTASLQHRRVMTFLRHWVPSVPSTQFLNRWIFTWIISLVVSCRYFGFLEHVTIKSIWFHSLLTAKHIRQVAEKKLAEVGFGHVCLHTNAGSGGASYSCAGKSVR